MVTPKGDFAVVVKAAKSTAQASTTITVRVQ
jgi:hypothetical protein